MLDLVGGGGGGEGLYAASKGGGSGVQENSGGAGPAGDPPKPEKPKACASVFEEWKEVTLKNGTKIPLVKETKFCVEVTDTYQKAQDAADAKAKAFLDKIEQNRVDLQQLIKESHQEMFRQPKF